MWAAANVAFALCPELSQGAILALDRHGTPEQKAQYLEKLVSGEWTGTMCLTEPQAGSDLAALTTRAEPQADGSYLISGRKIYITWGDHPMTSNVVHLVLARLPGAPQGTKGISLFLVPKFKLNADGTPGERNDVFPVSVEHKLGIHASPTCVMAFGDQGGALGSLVGAPNEGLAAMFTMMNYMRLGVGVQGAGLADRSYQAAVLYARDRVQGRAPGEKGRVPIIRHPDIRRTLLQMRSMAQAARAICYYTASCLDRGHHGGDDAEQSAMWVARAELMTPIAKAFASELGQQVTELGIQVHGGMGYVEETGVAQYYRDARIASIYEGTNAIQAIDLAGRKLMRDGGATVSAFVSDMRSVDAPLANAGEEMSALRLWLARGLDEVVACSTFLLNGERKDPELVSAAAFNYLMLVGYVIGGWQLARGALAASRALEADSSDAAFLRTQVVMARFYAEHLLPRALAHGAAVRAGSGTVMALTADQF
jgi:alkylation response protein AidB-like acyl-CoA dehydrogenase